MHLKNRNSGSAAINKAAVVKKGVSAHLAPLREAIQHPALFLRTHCYALWLLYLPVYLLYFEMLQLRTVPAEAIHLVETPFDRMVPTIPAFFIPYAFWWLWNTA